MDKKLRSIGTARKLTWSCGDITVLSMGANLVLKYIQNECNKQKYKDKATTVFGKIMTAKFIAIVTSGGLLSAYSYWYTNKRAWTDPDIKPAVLTLWVEDGRSGCDTVNLVQRSRHNTPLALLLTCVWCYRVIAAVLISTPIYSIRSGTRFATRHGK